MRDSLGFDLALSGFLASAPQIMLCVLVMLSAASADWLRARCCSTGAPRTPSLPPHLLVLCCCVFGCVLCCWHGNTARRLVCTHCVVTNVVARIIYRRDAPNLSMPIYLLIWQCGVDWSQVSSARYSPALVWARPHSSASSSAWAMLPHRKGQSSARLVPAAAHTTPVYLLHVSITAGE
jgi:hypothetical protein